MAEPPLILEDESNYRKKFAIIKTDTDKKKCCINSICEAKNGKLFILDSANKKVKLLDHTYDVLNEIELVLKPFSMCGIDPTDCRLVAVTALKAPNEWAVVFIREQADQLEMIHTAWLDHMCRGIACNGNRLYIASGIEMHCGNVDVAQLRTMTADTAGAAVITDERILFTWTLADSVLERVSITLRDVQRGKQNGNLDVSAARTQIASLLTNLQRLENDHTVPDDLLKSTIQSVVLVRDSLPDLTQHAQHSSHSVDRYDVGTLRNFTRPARRSRLQKQKPGPKPKEVRLKFYLLPDGCKFSKQDAAIERHQAIGYGFPPAYYHDGKGEAHPFSLDLAEADFKENIRSLYARLTGKDFSLFTNTKSRDLVAAPFSPTHFKTLKYQGTVVIKIQDHPQENTDNEQLVALPAENSTTHPVSHVIPTPAVIRPVVMRPAPAAIQPVVTTPAPTVDTFFGGTEEARGKDWTTYGPLNTITSCAVSKDGATLYVVNQVDNQLTMVYGDGLRETSSLVGDYGWTYEKWKVDPGLHMTDSGQLLGCGGKKNDAIFLFNRDGDRVLELGRQEFTGVERPRSIYYSENTGSIIIGLWKNDILCVFTKRD